MGSHRGKTWNGSGLFSFIRNVTGLFHVHTSVLSVHKSNRNSILPLGNSGVACPVKKAGTVKPWSAPKCSIQMSDSSVNT